MGRVTEDVSATRGIYTPGITRTGGIPNLKQITILALSGNLNLSKLDNWFINPHFICSILLLIKTIQFIDFFTESNHYPRVYILWPPGSKLHHLVSSVGMKKIILSLEFQN